MLACHRECVGSVLRESSAEQSHLVNRGFECAQRLADLGRFLSFVLGNEAVAFFA